MPLVDIEVVEGVFDDAQKEKMIEKLTDAVAEVEGENMRQMNWVRVKEVQSGQRGIGGHLLRTYDVKTMAAE